MQTEDLLIVLFCAVDDWLQAHPPPQRPGARPACSDSEMLTFALARELLGYDSERRFRRVLNADWRHLFPHIPAQSEFNRRTRWLWGAFEELRQHWLAGLPAATEDWYAFDTSPLPVRHPSRVRGPDQWSLPFDLQAGFGRCAAKALWFYGFRVATLAPLIDPIPLRWALVPAAVNEREVLAAMLEGLGPLKLLADKGLRSRALSEELAARDILLLTPPTKAQRASMPAGLRRFIAAHRNRIEGSYTTMKDQLHLEHHRALTGWGLLTRLAIKFAAYTLRAALRRAGWDVE
jgi:Transposase DDE domain